ncbi:MAG TPA: hypothetical protein DCQ28_12290 [Bacteroidetes bacterium]|nr:hypothetical protein [Bacteroidota bacterium]
MRMSYIDVEELASYVLANGNKELAEEIQENGDYDNLLMEKYDDQIDMSIFEKVVNDLIKFTPVLQSPITNELFNCFGVRDGSDFVAICKQSAE